MTMTSDNRQTDKKQLKKEVKEEGGKGGRR
jgi:hypothetical protein